jgi:hypothetical protein
MSPMRALLSPAAVVYGLAFLQSQTPADVPWPVNGGVDNIRYSPLKEINRENVGKLQVAWTYDSHDSFRASEMQSKPRRRRRRAVCHRADAKGGRGGSGELEGNLEFRSEWRREQPGAVQAPRRYAVGD